MHAFYYDVFHKLLPCAPVQFFPNLHQRNTGNPYDKTEAAAQHGLLVSHKADIHAAARSKDKKEIQKGQKRSRIFHSKRNYPFCKKIAASRWKQSCLSCLFSKKFPHSKPSRQSFKAKSFIIA